MEWCCVPQLFHVRFFQADTTQSGRDEKTTASSGLSTVNEPIDLLNDEGAGIQDDLWKLTVQHKLRSAKSIDNQFFGNLSAHTTFDSALEALTQAYNENGFARKMPLVQNLLKAIRPFTTVITTMVQSDPTISALVWGCIQMVLHVSLNRFRNIAIISF